jgi:short-chain Z-isoprenyl diphosphate synthase
VTLWLLSTDNLARPERELAPLLTIIENAVTDLAATGRWRIHPVGALRPAPGRHRDRLAEGRERSTESVTGMTVNVAVGYGGRQEIADAVRALLAERAGAGATMEHVARIPHRRGHRVPISTPAANPTPIWSFARRASSGSPASCSGRAPTASSTFCEAYWPDFRRVDFLRALRAYAERHRRFGG